MSICATVVPGAISLPRLVVQCVRLTPNPTMRSLSPTSSLDAGEANPPLMPSDQGSPANSPCPHTDVASSAPARSASFAMASSAPEITAPRPAMNTGRFALSIASARRRTLSGSGCSGPGAAGSASGGIFPVRTASCTSVGRLSTTVCRSRSARVTARSVSSRAVAGVWMRSATAPTERAIAAWSKWKLFFTAPAGTSPASTSSGVRLLAASAIPVSALVSPGPECTLTSVSSCVALA